MFYTILKAEFYYLWLMFDEIAIFFYHNLNFLFDIFLTRICLYSESWLRICIYNLHQHIKNDTDSTDVDEYVVIILQIIKMYIGQVCIL
jgi:hypothetical protein